MQLALSLLSRVLYSLFLIPCASSNTEVLEALRDCLENLTIESERDPSRCYTDEESSRCYGMPGVCKLDAETSTTEVRLDSSEYFFYNQSSQELCMKKVPLKHLRLRHGYDLKDGEVTLLQVYMTLDRDWIMRQINLELSCLSIESTRSSEHQKCCVHLQDYINQEATSMSYTGSLLLPTSGVEVRFRGKGKRISRLGGIELGAMEKKVLDSSSRSFFLEVISESMSDHKPTIVEELFKIAKAHGLKALLPPLVVICLFFFLFCTRKYWCPVLMQKLPWLDRLLHPNRHEVKPQKSWSSNGSSNNYAEPEELNLFGDMRMQPLEVEVAEEAIVAVDVEIDNNGAVNIENGENRQDFDNQLRNNNPNLDVDEAPEDNVGADFVNDNNGIEGNNLDELDEESLIEAAPPYEEHHMGYEDYEDRDTTMGSEIDDINVLGSGESLNGDASVV